MRTKGWNCCFSPKNFLQVRKGKLDWNSFSSLCGILQNPGRKKWTLEHRLAVDKNFFFYPGMVTAGGAHLFNSNYTLYEHINWHSLTRTTFPLAVPLHRWNAHTIADTHGIFYYCDQPNPHYLNFIDPLKTSQVTNIPFFDEGASPWQLEINFDNRSLLVQERQENRLFLHDIETGQHSLLGKDIRNCEWNTQETFLGYPNHRLYSELSLYDVRLALPTSVHRMPLEGDEEMLHPAFQVNGHYVCIAQSDPDQRDDTDLVLLSVLDLRKASSPVLSYRPLVLGFNPTFLPPFLLYQSENGDMANMRVMDIFSGAIIQDIFLMPSDTWVWMTCVQIQQQWKILAYADDEVLLFQ